MDQPDDDVQPDPEQFVGKLDAYLAWAEAHPTTNPHWCPRHWAPCPVEQLPGIVASIILMGEAMALVPDDVRTPDALNSWFANQLTPTCCKLGDEKMTWLWALLGRLRADELCGAIPTTRGRRSCFYERGHEGAHEWEKPVTSVFALMGDQ